MKTKLVLVCLFSAVLSIPAPGADMWEVQQARRGQGWGTSCSLALDSADNPHVAHYNSDRNQGVEYTYSTGSNWISQTVHPMGLHPSLGIDGSDGPHISFSVNDWNNGTHGVYYARRGAIGLSVEPVSTSNWECVTSLDLDTSGGVHIGYYDNSVGGLWYAHQTGGAWTSAVLDANGARGPDLTVNNTGDPCFFYAANWPIDYFYGRLEGETWTTVQFPTGNIGNPSLAFDAATAPHVSYWTSWVGGEAVQYAYLDGATWHTSEVERVFGQHTSLAFDSGGTPHVTYAVDNGPAGEIRHAWMVGGSWTSEVVAAGSFGGPTSLALTSNDAPRVAFTGTDGLYVASLVADTDGDKMPDNWEDKNGFNKSDPTDAGGDADEDLLNNLDEYRSQTNPRKEDTDGDTFNDKTEIDLGTDPLDPKHFPATGWSIEVVGSAEAEGAAVAAVALTGSTPHVAYVSSNSFVTVATGGGWTAEEVASVSTGGPFSMGLEFDGSGRPHVVYGPEGEISYATRNGAWTAETVASGGGLGDASLAIGGDAVPQIASVDYWAWPGAVHAAWREASGTWTARVFEVEHSVAPSIAVNSNHNPMVCYSYDDGATWGIRINTWSGSDWGVEDVYTDYGNAPDLVLGPGGEPHVAFLRGFLVDALVYATKNPSTGAWDLQPVEESRIFDFSLALDAAGLPHLSYRAEDRKELRYAHWDTGTSQWQIQVVDSTGDTGYGNDIAVDANGGVHLGYVDKTTGKAMYAYMPSGTGPVDSDGDGLPDPHETKTGKFVSPIDTGTDPHNPDTDGDGNDDYQEVFVLGTDPNNPDSNLKPEPPAPPQPGQGMILQWHSVAGKTYQVMHSPDLTAGFAPISGLLPATPPLNLYTDTVVRAGANCYGIAVSTGP